MGARKLAPQSHKHSPRSREPPTRSDIRLTRRRDACIHPGSVRPLTMRVGDHDSMCVRPTSPVPPPRVSDRRGGPWSASRVRRLFSSISCRDASRSGRSRRGSTVPPAARRPTSLSGVNQGRGGYVVLQRLRDDDWRILGEVDRRPGLPARRSRAQAIRDVLGREPAADEVFAVLPRSEWRLGLDS